MTTSVEREALMRDLFQAAGERAVSAHRAEQQGIRMGALVDQLRSGYKVSISEISRQTGIPRATLNDLVKAARAAGFATGDPASRIPWLSGGEFIDYVREHGPVSEIVASFADSDVVYLSQQPFARFIDGEYMRVPHVMVYCEGVSDWVILENASVGYGGTGPSNAYRALLGIGLGDELAGQLAYENRISHLTIDDNGQPTWIEEGRRWPRVSLPLPQPIDGGRRFRLKFAPDLSDIGLTVRGMDGLADPTMGGFYPADPSDGLTLEQRLFEYLDEPPTWLQGTRRASLFTSRNAAYEAGFADEYAGKRSRIIGLPFPSHVYQLVIEQGPLQIWVAEWVPEDPTQWVPSEFHGRLQAAGLFPQEIIERDGASALRKFITGHARNRPTEIRIDGGVTWRPSMETESGPDDQENA
jgi:hypothetical protein